MPATGISLVIIHDRTNFFSMFFTVLLFFFTWSNTIKNVTKGTGTKKSLEVFKRQVAHPHRAPQLSISIPQPFRLLAWLIAQPVLWAVSQETNGWIIGNKQLDSSPNRHNYMSVYVFALNALLKSSSWRWIGENGGATLNIMITGCERKYLKTSQEICETVTRTALICQDTL